MVVGMVLNARWLLEYFFKIEFDNFNLERNFAYKLLTIVFAYFFMNVLNIEQKVTNVEWVAYFVLLLSALYINSLQYDIKNYNDDVEQARGSFTSANMMDHSVYLNSNKK